VSAAKDQSKVNDDDGDVRRAAASTLVASRATNMNARRCSVRSLKLTKDDGFR